VPVLKLLTVPQDHALAAVALTGLLILVNVIGIQESSLLNLILALLDLVTQVALVVLGVWLLLNFNTVLHNIHLGVAPTWGKFLAGISIAMVTYLCGHRCRFVGVHLSTDDRHERFPRPSGRAWRLYDGPSDQVEGRPGGRHRQLLPT
jgi:L-asparagine transporter-like permease